MEATEVIKGPENRLRDSDLNANEAWALASSHMTPPDSEGREEVMSGDNLPGILQTNRALALTPDNVLRGIRTIEQENSIRAAAPYEDGIIALFGGEFMFKFKHKIYLGPLDDEGLATTFSIELFDKGESVDPAGLNLKLDSSYDPLYEQPVIVDKRINMHSLGSTS